MSGKRRLRAGDLVMHDDVPCRVLRRRRVSALAMFQTCEFEVLLETLDGEQVGWIGQNEIEKAGGEADEA
jgi:hypothetical protein